MGEWRYSFTILDLEVSGQLYALAALIVGNELPVSLDRRLCGPQSWAECCREERNLVPARNRTLAVQPAVRHYTDSYPSSMIFINRS
jgi:hypothetical protein